VKLHAAVLPAASRAAQVTVVSPMANAEPLVGAQLTLAPGQLSLALAANSTTAEHWPASVVAVMFAGQATVGLSASVTVTVKLHAAVLPAASRAAQVTVVSPMANAEPLAGVQLTLAPGQLSLALAANSTTAEHWPASVVAVMFAGQVTVGFSASRTVTVKLHVAALPAASRAVQVTGVSPMANVEPLAGTQLTLAPGQLSLALAANSTTAEHWPASVVAVMFAGQATVGLSASVTVTVKLHSAALPAASVAVQRTVVVPTGNAVLLGGTQAKAVTPQLSVAFGVNSTTAAQVPDSLPITTSAGHVSVGASASMTVTVKLQLERLPASSVAVHSTVVMPVGNVEPLAGTHCNVTPGELSATLTV
jgi:hypothetical protein